MFFIFSYLHNKSMGIIFSRTFFRGNYPLSHNATPYFLRPLLLSLRRQNYNQISAVAVYEEFHSRLLIRTDFLFIFFFQLRDVAHGFYDISSLYRIVILIGKADYYIQDLASDSKATGGYHS